MYYLLISLGATAGLAWFLKRAGSVDEGKAINISFVILVSGFLGARLLHILFEAPSVYWANPWLIVEFWQGGFVFYGGLIAGLIAGVIYCRKKEYDVPLWLDRGGVSLGLAYAIGRVGCFLNGCCYGRVCRLPWAVRFPTHLGWGVAIQPRHPTQLYAAFGELLAIAIVLLLERLKLVKFKGQQFWCWLILHAINRLVMEAFRDDERGVFFLGWSLSSVISVVFILTGVSVLIFKLRRAPDLHSQAQ